MAEVSGTRLARVHDGPGGRTEAVRMRLVDDTIGDAALLPCRARAALLSDKGLGPAQRVAGFPGPSPHPALNTTSVMKP